MCIFIQSFKCNRLLNLLRHYSIFNALWDQFLEKTKEIRHVLSQTYPTMQCVYCGFILQLFDSVLMTQAQGGGGGAGKKTEETLFEIANDILSKVLIFYLRY